MLGRGEGRDGAPPPQSWTGAACAWCAWRPLLPWRWRLPAAGTPVRAQAGWEGPWRKRLAHLLLLVCVRVHLAQQPSQRPEAQAGADGQGHQLHAARGSVSACAGALWGLQGTWGRCTCLHAHSGLPVPGGLLHQGAAVVGGDHQPPAGARAPSLRSRPGGRCVSRAGQGAGRNPVGWRVSAQHEADLAATAQGGSACLAGAGASTAVLFERLGQQAEHAATKPWPSARGDWPLG